MLMRAIMEMRAREGHPRNGGITAGGSGWGLSAHVYLKVIMATSWVRNRCRKVIEDLSQADLTWDAFCDEAVPRLRAAVGFDCWCLSLCDPGNGLPANGVADNPPLGGALGRFWHIEYHLPDVNKHAWLARDHRHVGILSAVTRRDLARSTRWHQLLGPGGLGDELRGAVVADGACWGGLTFHRERRTAPFCDDDAAFVSGLLPALAGAARAAWRAPSPPGLEPVRQPGVIVVGPADQIAAATPSARIWFERIGPDYRSQVHALTARLRADLRGASRGRHRCVPVPAMASGSSCTPRRFPHLAAATSRSRCRSRDRRPRRRSSCARTRFPAGSAK
jgi:hypothetical protein